jgi:hypothetical protein
MARNIENYIEVVKYLTRLAETTVGVTFVKMVVYILQTNEKKLLMRN